MPSSAHGKKQMQTGGIPDNSLSCGTSKNNCRYVHEKNVDETYLLNNSCKFDLTMFLRDVNNFEERLYIRSICFH